MKRVSDYSRRHRGRYRGERDGAGQTLTTVSWGGAYSKSQLKAYDEPFEKEFGVKDPPRGQVEPGPGRHPRPGRGR